MRPLNILMVTAWLPTNEAGGVGTVIRTLNQGLSGKHAVCVLVTDWNSPRLTRTDSSGMRLHLLRLRRPYLEKRPVAGFLGWLRDLPRTLLDLKRLVSANKIDVVHLHFASSYQWYFRVLRWLGGPPYLVTLHRGETLNFDKQNLVDQALTRFMLRGAARIVAVSEWLAERAAATFSGCGEIGVVHNGLNLADIDAQVSCQDQVALPCAVPDGYVLSVANVTHYKGVDVAIRAWPRVRAQLPDLHLVVAGEPREMWDHCQELVDALDCRHRVHLLGAMTHRQVLKLMSGATGLICPSRNEGLPMVLLEAGALGLPVVCSRIGPFVEVARGDDSAILIPPDDPAALAEAVVRVARDAVLRERLGRALQARVRQDFSAEHMVRQYLHIYDQLLGRA